MMRARAVVEVILNELEAWDADRIERFVVGAACVPHGNGGDAKIFQRLHPLRKNWRLSGVLLQINPQDFSGAVVHVEIARNLRLFRFKDNRTGWFAHVLWLLQFLRSG